MDDVIADLTTQHHYGTQHEFNYITGRELDYDLLRSAGELPARLNGSAIEALSHPVSYLDNVPIEMLLTVRKNEGDAFQVYRDAVASLVGTVALGTPRQAREAIDDVVRPELNRIDRVLKQSRRAAIKSLIQDVGIYSGLISIGLLSGLVPESWHTAAAIIGGAAGAKSAAEKAVGLFKVPAAISDNKYYFLWKARRTAGPQRIGR